MKIIIGGEFEDTQNQLLFAVINYFRDINLQAKS